MIQMPISQKTHGKEFPSLQLTLKYENVERSRVQSRSELAAEKQVQETNLHGGSAILWSRGGDRRGAGSRPGARVSRGSGLGTSPPCLSSAPSHSPHLEEILFGILRVCLYIQGAEPVNPGPVISGTYQNHLCP